MARFDTGQLPPHRPGVAITVAAGVLVARAKGPTRTRRAAAPVIAAAGVACRTTPPSRRACARGPTPPPSCRGAAGPAGVALPRPLRPPSLPCHRPGRCSRTARPVTHPIPSSGGAPRYQARPLLDRPSFAAAQGGGRNTAVVYRGLRSRAQVSQRPSSDGLLLLTPADPAPFPIPPPPPHPTLLSVGPCRRTRPVSACARVRACVYGPSDRAPAAGWTGRSWARSSSPPARPARSSTWPAGHRRLGKGGGAGGGRGWADSDSRAAPTRTWAAMLAARWRRAAGGGPGGGAHGPGGRRAGVPPRLPLPMPRQSLRWLGSGWRSEIGVGGEIAPLRCHHARLLVTIVAASG